MNRAVDIYCAGPLFNDMELTANLHMYETLHKWFPRAIIYLPQLHGEVAMGTSPNECYRNDINALYDCTIVLANLDGIVVDPGTAYECGYAHAISKYVIAVTTDNRNFMNGKQNAMIQYGVDEIINLQHCADQESLHEALSRHFAELNIISELV